MSLMGVQRPNPVQITSAFSNGMQCTFILLCGDELRKPAGYVVDPRSFLVVQLLAEALLEREGHFLCSAVLGMVRVEQIEVEERDVRGFVLGIPNDAFLQQFQARLEVVSGDGALRQGVCVRRPAACQKED